MRLLGEPAHELIVRAENDLLRLHRPLGQFEAHDDDLVALLDEVSRRAVHADIAAAAWAGDGVGFKAGAAGVADHQDALSWDEADHVHQFFVDRDTANVLQIGFSNCGLVNLGT